MNDKISKSEDVTWEGLKIYKTFDYGKFKLVKGNRKVKTFQVNRLKASYQKGQIPVPLIVNQSYEIIDGQHRLEAIRQLEFPVAYTIIEGLGIKDIQILNTQQKNWSMDDHLKCWVERGKKMYIDYDEKIHQKFNFDHVTKLLIIKGKHPMQSKTEEEAIKEKDEGKIREGLTEQFRNGDFEATEKEFKHAIEVGLKIEDVERYFIDHISWVQKKSLWNAVRKLADYSDYNHSEMMKKLDIQESRIERLLMRFKKLTTNEFLTVLEDIYNYRRHQEPVVFRHNLRVKDRAIQMPREISV